MNRRFSTVELRQSELADSSVATIYLECMEAEKRLRGANKMAAAALFEFRERHLAALWTRLGELDPELCNQLREAVCDWHDVAVKLRGGE
jgi:hypothetical protein